MDDTDEMIVKVIWYRALVFFRIGHLKSFMEFVASAEEKSFISFNTLPLPSLPFPCFVCLSHLSQSSSSKNQTPVSLRTLMETGRGDRLGKGGNSFEEDLDNSSTATDLVLMQVASFLKRELPIRLAHRINNLDNVPMMQDMKSVQQVRPLRACIERHV